MKSKSVKAPRKVAKKPFRFPTLATFEDMSLPARSRVFLRFVQSRPASEGYGYYDNYGCPLSRFGAGILRQKTAWGGASRFGAESYKSKQIDVIPLLSDISRSLYDHAKYGTLAQTLVKLIS